MGVFDCGREHGAARAALFRWQRDCVRGVERQHSPRDPRGVPVEAVGWTPQRLGGPAQARPPVVSFNRRLGAKRSRFSAPKMATSTRSTPTTVRRWSENIGTMVQAAPGRNFVAYDPLAKDIVLVGTRNSAGANALVALNVDDGVPVWSFTNLSSQGGDDTDRQGDGSIRPPRSPSRSRRDGRTCRWLWSRWGSRGTTRSTRTIRFWQPPNSSPEKRRSVSGLYRIQFRLGNTGREWHRRGPLPPARTTETAGARSITLSAASISTVRTAR